MSGSKSELPRGLYQISRSPYLFFSWRDSRGRQHMQSTRTSDPVDALVFKRQFLELDEKAEDLSKLPLSVVAEKYFEWKAANCSDKTIVRERRMFKNVLSFFRQGQSRALDSSAADPPLPDRASEAHQLHHEKTGRAARGNYEMLLLKGVMAYARCWTAELEVGYQPLRQPKSRAGKVASGEQLKNMIYTAHPEWQLAM